MLQDSSTHSLESSDTLIDMHQESQWVDCSDVQEISNDPVHFDRKRRSRQSFRSMSVSKSSRTDDSVTKFMTGSMRTAVCAAVGYQLTGHKWQIFDPINKRSFIQLLTLIVCKNWNCQEGITRTSHASNSTETIVIVLAAAKHAVNHAVRTTYLQS